MRVVAVLEGLGRIEKHAGQSVLGILDAYQTVQIGEQFTRCGTAIGVWDIQLYSIAPLNSQRFVHVGTTKMLLAKVALVPYLVVIVIVLPQCPNAVDVGVVNPKEGICRMKKNIERRVSRCLLTHGWQNETRQNVPSGLQSSAICPPIHWCKLSCGPDSNCFANRS